MNKFILPERKYSLLFENAVDPIVIIDKEGRFAEVNKKVEEILGYKRKDLIGKKFTEIGILTRKSKMIVYKNFVKRMLGFDIKPYESEIVKKNSEIIIGEINGSVIKENGKVIGDMIIIRDVTERKKMEDKIKESEERFRELFENAKDGIVYIDNFGVIKDANKQTIEFFGGTKKELIGKQFTRIGILSLREIPGQLKIFSNVLRGKEGILFKTFKNKKGEIITLECSVSALKRENKNVGIIVIMRDVTQRAKMEEELLFKTSILEAQTETTLDGILIVDSNGKTIFYNKRFGEIWNIPQSILNTKNDKKMLDQVLYQLKDPSDFLNRVNYLYDHKEEKSRDEIELKDGKVFDRFSSPLVDSKNIYHGRIWYFHDISDIKKAEEEIKKAKDELQKSYKGLRVLDKLKDEFMNVSAHELKTPLVPIIGYIELMLQNKKSKINKKEREQLEICLKNAVRLKNLITDVSDVSKLETKNMKFDMKAVKIENIINSVAETFKPEIKNKNLNLVLNIQSNLPIIKGDSERLVQALSKLVENSVKFTDNGEIRISAQRQKNNIIVRVEDTGIGIAKDKIPKLFTKFFQADESPTRKTKGTGLGLSICKDIIKAHKGKVLAESKGLGKGSTFTFTLPIKS